MSKDSRFQQLTALLGGFFSPKTQAFFDEPGAYTEFDGPNFQESKATYEYLRDLYLPLIQTGRLGNLSHNALTTIQGQAQNAVNSFSQVERTRDQGSFQNFSGHLDSFAYHTRMVGVPYLAIDGETIDSVRAALSKELQSVEEALTKLRENNADVDKLKENIRTLIAPAVSGALSKAFTERRDSLQKTRYVWLTIIVVIVGVVLYFIYDFANSLGVTIAAAATAGKPASNMWQLIVIRSIVLVPALAVLGFAIAQYRKERDFEEEYAHKAAVSISLPTYGDLTKDQKVNDQILTAATNVIFSSPVDKARKVDGSPAVIQGARELIDTVAKILPRRG